MELDTNLSLTLAQTLTQSICERIFGHFTSRRCYDSTNFNFAFLNSSHNLGGIQSLDQNSILEENSQLHEIDT